MTQAAMGLDTSSRALSGKVMLVFGASSGIGRETALLASDNGAKIVVASRRITLCNELVDEIHERGGEAMFVQADVSKAEDSTHCVAAIIKRFGRLDCAANIAGVTGAFEPLSQGNPDNWDLVMDTNLKGVWTAMRAQAGAMVAGGAIVNVSSWMAGGGMELTAPYTASKAGLEGMSRALAVELAASGIRVNVVAPGAVATEMAFRLGENTLEPFRKHTPLGELALTADVAQAIIWLCSDMSRMVTGHILTVDGGYSISGHRGFFK